LSTWAERDVELLTADGGFDTGRLHERRDEEQILAVGSKSFASHRDLAEDPHP
jgi:hypothetical protein